MKPLLPAAILTLFLAGCASQQIGGPTAPSGAADAGLLTLPSGRSFAVYPHQLAYTGRASYRWPDGRSYDGVFRDGLPEGMGTGTWPGGDTYRGTWHQGRKHGHGELTTGDGRRYVGDFVDGRRQGQGVELSSTGLYRGDWAGDLPHGEGRFHGTDGATYDGQWQQGKRHGHGTYTDTLGNTYTGRWRDDQPDGFGVLENTDGSRYEGEWRQGVQQGYGRAISAAGETYEGTWAGGKRHGFGINRRLDGSRYEGEWDQGLRAGRGRETYADGGYYDGFWEADQPLGTGTRRYAAGFEISGAWNGTRIHTGLLHLPSGAEYAGPLLSQSNTIVEPALLGWLEEQAAKGDPQAHFLLGTAYTEYASPAPDPFAATRHFRVAARAGIAEAQYRLARLLMAKTPGQAMAWLVKAAEQGHAGASTMLGERYASGGEEPRDLPLAIRYLEAGANAGSLSARRALAWLLATTNEEAVRDGERALTLIRPLAIMRGGWQDLDTLAAAHAALGQYREASEALTRAVDLAHRVLTAQDPRLKALQARLDTYRAARSGD